MSHDTMLIVTAETAPRHIRGSLISTYQLFVRFLPHRRFRQKINANPDHLGYLLGRVYQLWLLRTPKK